VLPGTIVPKKLLPDIGAVAIYFGHLDNLLSRILWALLGIRADRGRIVTQSINSFSSRVELFRALAIQKNPTRKERISSICQQLRFAGDDRNRLKHDDIGQSEHDDDYEDRSSVTVFRGEDPYRFDFETLRDLQWRLWRLYDVLTDFGQKKRGWLDAPLPSLDKSPTRLLRQAKEQKPKLGKPQRPRKSSSPKSPLPRKMTFRL
jgi:hypothetical protein